MVLFHSAERNETAASKAIRLLGLKRQDVRKIIFVQTYGIRVMSIEHCRSNRLKLELSVRLDNRVK